MRIIIATDTLVVGIDFPNVEDVINIECKHPNHGRQQKGRAGRQGDDVRGSRGVTYVTKSMMHRAQKMVEKYQGSGQDGLGERFTTPFAVPRAQVRHSPTHSCC